MNEGRLEWFASFVAILSSTLRAFNVGYQNLTYIVSILAYCVFLYYAKKPSQKFVNLFYIATALIGAWQWTVVKK